ncbi:MAG: hypothetical protein QM778_05965 [Myxococcales bacterium]
MKLVLGRSGVLWTALVVLGCGDDSDGGAADAGPEEAACPQLAGTWKISDHCGGAALIGMDVTVTQSGCDLTVNSLGTYTGKVGEDGKFTLAGKSANDMPVSCTGTATTTEIDETCSESCHVVLSRPE